VLPYARSSDGCIAAVTRIDFPDPASPGTEGKAGGSVRRWAYHRQTDQLTSAAASPPTRNPGIGEVMQESFVGYSEWVAFDIRLHRDPLGFAERVEVCVDPAEVASGTRAFRSPEGIGWLVGDGLVVDVDHARLDPVGEFEGRKGIVRGRRIHRR